MLSAPNEEKDYISFEDENGAPLYFRIPSSAGMIPIRIDGVEVLNRSSERSRISVEYQIDEGHQECPDLTQIGDKETIHIMTVLKEKVPEMVVEMLEEARELEQEELNERNLQVESVTD